MLWEKKSWTMQSGDDVKEASNKYFVKKVLFWKKVFFFLSGNPISWSRLERSIPEIDTPAPLRTETKPLLLLFPKKKALNATTRLTGFSRKVCRLFLDDLINGSFLLPSFSLSFCERAWPFANFTFCEILSLWPQAPSHALPRKKVRSALFWHKKIEVKYLQRIVESVEISVCYKKKSRETRKLMPWLFNRALKSERFH